MVNRCRPALMDSRQLRESRGVELDGEGRDTPSLDERTMGLSRGVPLMCGREVGRLPDYWIAPIP